MVLDERTLIQTQASSAASGSGAISANNNAWSQYNSLVSQYGLTPMSRSDFDTAMPYNPSDTSQSAVKFINNVLKPTYQQIADRINTLNQQTAKATGQPYTAISATALTPTSWDSSKYIDNMNAQLSAPYSTASYNSQNLPNIPNIETDPIAKQVMSELNAVVAKGAGTFQAPGIAAEEADVNAWNQALTQLNAPQNALALQQLNKTVNENYMAANPYSIGSGNQMKASQDAVNNLLMNELAQQNSTALSLGSSQYNQDYNTAWNQYLNQQNQYNAAQQNLLSIANTSTNQKTEDYWNNQNHAWSVADQQNQKALGNYQQQQQQQYAQQIAQMYQPNSSAWYQPLINAAATGAGFAVGNAVVPGVGGSSSGSNSQGYNPKLDVSGGYDMFGYNPSGDSLGFNNYGLSNLGYSFGNPTKTP